MIATNEKIRILKQKFEDPAVPLNDKIDIIEFFKEFSDVFYGDIDIYSFFRQLEDISSKWTHKE